MADLLDKAYKLEACGSLDGRGAVGGTKADAFTAWSQVTGVDHTDPEKLKEVYAAVAAIHKNKAERTAKAAAAHKAAATRSARGQPPPGKMGRRKPRT